MDQLIRFRCECGKKLKATRDIIGKKVRCTKCVRIHLVPESDCLPPKKTASAAASTTSTQLKVSQATSAQQDAGAIESKQQDLAALQPKNATGSKSKKLTASKSKASKPRPSVVPKKSSLTIPDTMAAKEPSLLPSNDDSDSRFKLDPKFDPEPSDSPLNPDLTSNLITDSDALEIERKETTFPPRPQHSKLKRPTGKTKLVLGIAASAVGLLLLTFTTVFFVFGDSAHPKEFSEQPEVRHYVQKIEEFRKSQRTLKIVSEAYVKSNSPTAEEREQIEAFNRSIEPLSNQQIKLDEALALFKATKYEKARSALIAATQTLDEKIPELQSKTKDFSSKFR